MDSRAKSFLSNGVLRGLERPDPCRKINCDGGLQRKLLHQNDANFAGSDLQTYQGLKHRVELIQQRLVLCRCDFGVSGLVDAAAR